MIWRENHISTAIWQKYYQESAPFAEKYVNVRNGKWANSLDK